MLTNTRYISRLYLMWLFFSIIAPSDLCATNIPLIYHGTFFTHQGTTLSAEDTNLVTQMVDLTQIPHPIILFTQDSESCGSIHVMNIITPEGNKRPTPCIELNSGKWNLLPAEQKLFILLHEAAHYTLGHCYKKKPTSYAEHIINKYGKIAFLYFETISCGLALGTLHISFDIVHKKNLKAGCVFFPLGALSTACYIYCRNYMIESQKQEYDADITASKWLQNASSGITYFKTSTTQSCKPEKHAWFRQTLKCIENCLEVILADYLKLSTHPSDHARVAYLAAWQKYHSRVARPLSNL